MKTPAIIHAKPKNITELMDQLLDGFTLVRNNPESREQVKEMNNSAGKVIGLLAKQLEYALLRKEIPEIPFIGEGMMLRKVGGEVKAIPVATRKALKN